MGPTVPGIDAGTRQRLTARFGHEVEIWFDALPGVLTALADRWQFKLGSPIPRGSVSAVFRCRMADGRRAVLKASPDRARLAFEGAALDAWHTVHTPAVIALDEQLGALLIEAIEPGTPLVVSSIYPAAESVAKLLTSLHESGVSNPSYPTVEQRVAYLFDSSAKLYERHPELTALIPLDLYERGRRLATRLAQQGSPIVLLHGDLTPSNILDGGADRGAHRAARRGYQHGRRAARGLVCGIRRHERPGAREPRKRRRRRHGCSPGTRFAGVNGLAAEMPRRVRFLLEK